MTIVGKCPACGKVVTLQGHVHPAAVMCFDCVKKGAQPRSLHSTEEKQRMDAAEAKYQGDKDRLRDRQRQDWTPIDLGIARSDWVIAARKLRAERDVRFGANVFESEGRWVGELCEIAMDSLLTERGIAHVWIKDNPRGMPDFTIGSDVEFDLKGKTYARCPEGSWETGLNRTVARRNPQTEYAFMVRERETNHLWFLGSMLHEKFLQVSKLHPKGSRMPGSNGLVKDDTLVVRCDALTIPSWWSHAH